MLRACLRRLSQTPQFGHFKLPAIQNEPMYDYGKGSQRRIDLQVALKELRAEIALNGPIEVPCVVGSESITSSGILTQSAPTEHSLKLCTYTTATREIVQEAIKNALAAKSAWESMPFNDRAAIFLKAADLLTTKYRYQVMAATMLGQGKNAWQAEIDSAAELADFWRFNCQYAAEIYANQPTMNAGGTWNRMEYRPLEGFVVAYSPFNFTAIGGNLACAPALMGNVVLWKPSDTAIHSNYLVYQILKEAGLPDGVIQFIPGDPKMITEETFGHTEFAGLHFTGSTDIFKSLWKKASENLDIYKSFPRIVGETGGKNMHMIHESADIHNAALQTIRSSFEYNGQKCSACSRVYVPRSRFAEFRQILIAEHAKIKQGPVDSTMRLILDFENHMTAVINKASFDKITGYIKQVKTGENSSTEILAGGGSNDKVGYFIEPTILVTSDPHSSTMTDELFGPVVTIFVYDGSFEEALNLADSSTKYALTCAIFAQDRQALIFASDKLRNAAGNMYFNDKCTGAVVGQQPFGGARMSGTNDKAGSYLNLLRWVSPRTIKESFLPIKSFSYPSNVQN